MSQKATGTFEVNFVPQSDNDTPEIGRLILSKVFHGDLEASSKGQMISFRGSVPNSAGYVAIEKAEGSLHGKQGSFMLQHSGTMNRGEASLLVSVVPDSGTGELEGLSGVLTIIIKDGKHSYEFDYTLEKIKV